MYTPYLQHCNKHMRSLRSYPSCPANPDNRPNRQIDPWFKPSYHYHRTISIRFVNRDPSAVRNLQPVFHFAVLVHKTPFTLPLLRVGVERFLPRLVISFEPVSRQN
jgi:hypothetical protein